jgi:hypothetical protein
VQASRLGLWRQRRVLLWPLRRRAVRSHRSVGTGGGRYSSALVELHYASGRSRRLGRSCSGRCHTARVAPVQGESSDLHARAAAVGLRGTLCVSLEETVPFPGLPRPRAGPPARKLGSIEGYTAC